MAKLSKSTKEDVRGILLLARAIQVVEGYSGVVCSVFDAGYQAPDRIRSIAYALSSRAMQDLKFNLTRARAIRVFDVALAKLEKM